MLKKKVFPIIILILFLLKGFGFVLLMPGYWDPIIFLLLFFFFIKGFSFKPQYASLILLYVFFLFLSCLYSYVVNGQRLYKAIVHIYGFFSIIFYFLLVKKDYSSYEVEAVIQYISVIFCLCYILQWLLYPTVIFSGALDDTNINENQYRMRMPASMCGYLLFFGGINKYLIKKKLVYLTYSFLALFPIIIQGFRSLVILSLFSVIFMIPFVVKNGRKTVVYSCIIVLGLFLISNIGIVQEKIDEMSRRTESQQTYSNEDYIRYISLDYYWNHQFTKPYEKVIGGGVPVDKESEYYKTIAKVSASGLVWCDLGIIGLSMVIGIPAVFILVLIYCLLIFRFKAVEYQYVRFTLLVVLVSSIMTTMELYRDGNILLLSLLLYLEYKQSKDRQLR